jgi:hypothetical protein
MYPPQRIKAGLCYFIRFRPGALAQGRSAIHMIAVLPPSAKQAMGDKGGRQ